MGTHTYTVTGMTCAHCVNAVSAEVGRVEGVESVSVDLAAGVLVVQASAVDDEQIRQAVEEAGYTLSGRTR